MQNLALASTRSSHQREILCRSSTTTVDHIGQCVHVMFGELSNGADTVYYDAIHIVFLESGIHPLTTLSCESPVAPRPML